MTVIKSNNLLQGRFNWKSFEHCVTNSNVRWRKAMYGKFRRLEATLIDLMGLKAPEYDLLCDGFSSYFSAARFIVSDVRPKYVENLSVITGWVILRSKWGKQTLRPGDYWLETCAIDSEKLSRLGISSEQLAVRNLAQVVTTGSVTTN